MYGQKENLYSVHLITDTECHCITSQPYIHTAVREISALALSDIQIAYNIDIPFVSKEKITVWNYSVQKKSVSMTGEVASLPLTQRPQLVSCLSCTFESSPASCSGSSTTPLLLGTLVHL